MRLVRLWPPAPQAPVLGPGALEVRAIALGVMLLEPFPVALDAAGDHRLASLHENRTSLRMVGVQQRLPTPALQLGGQLPPEVRRVLQAGVQTESTVRRML